MSSSHAVLTNSAGKPPGRNDPCPCGSGRKYKQCCAVGPQAATPARLALGPQTVPGRKVAASAAAPPTREAKPRQGGVSRRGAPAAGHQPRSPRVARTLHDAARLVEAGRAEEAVSLLQEAGRLEPTNPLVWNDLGAALLRCDRVYDAANSLAHAVLLDDTMALAHYNLGLALARKTEVNAAMEAFRAATVRAPKYADAHMRLGELLQARGHAAEAAEAFESAAAAAVRNTTNERLAVASALVVRRRPEEAIALLRRARALDPKSIDLIRLHANTLLEAGRFDEAEEQLTGALALGAVGAYEYFTLTQLRKFTPQDRPLMQRMTGMLRAGDISEYDRMLLHFSLGKAHDDLREFEAAIGHFDAANRIRSATAQLNRRLLVSLVDRSIELFPDQAAFDASLGVDDERPVFILGLPRSGTTLVEQILSSHPGVARGGELGFWAEHGRPGMEPGAKPFTRGSLHELAGRYQALLRGISPDALRVTDKYPFNYLYIGLLRLAFPRAFIIHCRRHPVDTCLSMYTTYLSSAETHFMGNRENLVLYHGLYSRLMRHWREVLPAGRFLEIDYKTLVSDPEAETRRLVAFCELDWDDACLQPERNRRIVSTASIWQARQPVYRSSVERWRNYQPWLGPLADLLSDAERAG